MNPMTIFLIVMGIIVLIFLSFGIVMLILFQRRKLIVTNFLRDTGQWEKEFWKPESIGKTFVYDNETYYYDITLCTRDSWNRPIAHYYKGNPKQQIFDFALGNKKIVINTQEITQKDFTVLMLSKVLKDIFSDDEVLMWLLIILISLWIIAIALIIVTVTHKPPCELQNTNTTIDIIAQGCKKAITGVRATP